MPEQNEKLIDLLSKATSIDELMTALPKDITDKLGEGEKGINRTITLLIGLAPFAPEPATFDRDAFDAIVAVDEETEESLGQEESQKMIEAGIEMGFIKKADTPTERYMSNPQIEKLVSKLFEE